MQVLMDLNKTSVSAKEQMVRFMLCLWFLHLYNKRGCNITCTVHACYHNCSLVLTIVCTSNLWIRSYPVSKPVIFYSRAL